MIYGNYLSLIIYNIIVFLAFIFTGEPQILLLLLANIILLLFQSNKAMKEQEEHNKYHLEQFKRQTTRASIRAELLSKYNNISEEQLNKLVDEEYIKRKIEEAKQ